MQLLAKQQDETSLYSNRGVNAFSSYDRSLIIGGKVEEDLIHRVHTR